MLPIEDYKKIVETFPILCVDGVICRDGKFLLIKRRNEPLKGMFWVPGGRLLKGESLEIGFKRVMKQEVGLDVDITDTLGLFEEVFEKNPHTDGTVHTVSVVFEATCEGDVKLDEQSSEYKWADTLPDLFEIK